MEVRVGTVKKGKGFKTEQIILAVEKKIGAFTINDIEKLCPGTSRDVIRSNYEIKENYNPLAQVVVQNG